MRIKINLLILNLALINQVNSQVLSKKDIENNFCQKWNLISVEINNKPIELNSKQKNLHTSFLKDSTYITFNEKGADSGKWHYDYKKQIMIFNDLKGNNPDLKVKIEKLNSKECVIVIPDSKDGITKLFLHKFD
jgi:hypothetical protein